MKIEYKKGFNAFAYEKENEKFYFFMLIDKNFVTFDMGKIEKNEKILTSYFIDDNGIEKNIIKRTGIFEELIKNRTKKYKK